MHWEFPLERSSELGFGFRATHAVTVQHIDNLNWADPRALWVTELTLDGRNELVEAAMLHRFSSVAPGSMRLAMAPGQLLRFKLRNRSPRNLIVRLALIADSHL